jgi:Tol biopolymer transport system component
MSPDGTRYAFERQVGVNDQLFMTDQNGKVVRLTGPGKGGCGCGAYEPAWSPGGTEIAFAGADSQGQHIYIADATTGVIHRLSDARGVVGNPAWSPNGRLIAFTEETQTRSSLWVLDVATGKLRLVTRVNGQNPTWSPDGRAIAFSGGGIAGSAPGLWLIHADGTGLRKVSDSVILADGSLSWSPDGTQIAFASPRSTGRPPFVDIHVVDVSTGHERVLAGGFDFPVWSPDGRFVVAIRPAS